MKRQEVEERAAYHEAGHAVACCLTGIPFREVAILSDRTSTGRVETTNRLKGKNDAHFFMWLVKNILVDLAGGVAHAKFGAGFGFACMAGVRTSDRRHARHWSILLVGKFINPLPANHGLALSACERAAREFEIILLWACMALIEKNWSAVQPVAGALLEGKTLSSSEVRTIILETMRISPCFTVAPHGTAPA